MVKNLFRLDLASLSLLILLAWSPWITADYAAQHVVTTFESRWQGVADGCSLRCPQCGVSAQSRTVFGYNVSLTYACSASDRGQIVAVSTAVVRVSPFGTLRGLPAP